MSDKTVEQKMQDISEAFNECGMYCSGREITADKVIFKVISSCYAVKGAGSPINTYPHTEKLEKLLKKAGYKSQSMPIVNSRRPLKDFVVYF
jgi:hypothetical protein